VTGTSPWDGRECVPRATDATRTRALLSAADAADLWDLRCLVRERLVRWVREVEPDGLRKPRTERLSVASPHGGTVRLTS
jgi:hypothetical protein